ncbi:MAG: hypothetical protein M3160_04340 [Candidatus Eremiobacteraeota bacterium]|nr:hypothetical protein [Candidatus Eremiobacteraeota bacterium]
MNAALRLLCAAVSLWTMYGCSSPSQQKATTQAQEVSAVERATWKYHRTIKGITVKGETLMVSVDDHDWDALDADVQDAIRDSALSAWAKTWREHHPHRKARLRISIMGYFADQLGGASTRL